MRTATLMVSTVPCTLLPFPHLLPRPVPSAQEPSMPENKQKALIVSPSSSHPHGSPEPLPPAMVFHPLSTKPTGLSIGVDRFHAGPDDTLTRATVDPRPTQPDPSVLSLSVPSASRWCSFCVCKDCLSPGWAGVLRSIPGHFEPFLWILLSSRHRESPGT